MPMGKYLFWLSFKFRLHPYGIFQFLIFWVSGLFPCFSFKIRTIKHKMYWWYIIAFLIIYLFLQYLKKLSVPFFAAENDQFLMTIQENSSHSQFIIITFLLNFIPFTFLSKVQIFFSCCISTSVFLLGSLCRWEVCTWKCSFSGRS